MVCIAALEVSETESLALIGALDSHEQEIQDKNGHFDH